MSLLESLMDDRIRAFSKRYKLSDDARSELEALFQAMLEEESLHIDSPPPLYQPAQLLDESFDVNQTITDPKDSEAIRQAVFKALANEQSPENKASAPTPVQSPLHIPAPTERSLPPFQTLEEELEAWKQQSEEGAKPLSMSDSFLSLDSQGSSPDSPLDTLPPQERYEDLGKLGEGGMGEVRKVLDKQLKRVVAMKVIKSNLTDDFSLSIRFIEEAQATAQLQHPAIIPLHDLGRLPDGRYFFTMKEIKGKTLEQVIYELHDVSRQKGEWSKTEDGWTIRRLIDAFHKVCEAVGYAHSRGVLHRDLKPENVMLGAHGEVLVLDWGLVKVKGHAEKSKDWRKQTQEIVITDRSQEDEYTTMIGAVTGTPTYMSPEQAQGLADIDARTDVYSLGAVLYEILAGRPPYFGDEHDAVLRQLLDAPPPPLVAHGTGDLKPTWEHKDDVTQQGLPLSKEIVDICNKAMNRTFYQRYPDATALANDIEKWLEGDQKREEALTRIAEAKEKSAEAQDLLQQAQQLKERAAEVLEDIEPWDNEEDKRTGWSLLDEAERLEREANIKALESELHLQGSLVYDPFLTEARSTLANRYRALHQEAERKGDKDEQQRTEQLLFEHVKAIPPFHRDFKEHITYLRGDGAVSILTDPPGAEVILYRYVLQHRRLVPVRARTLGTTPLISLSLPMGSYMLLLKKPGHIDVRYPIQIRRQEHWHGVAPGDEDPYPIHLPKEGTLSAKECYIPAGWFWSGGDELATNRLPSQRLWLDGFIMRTFPVTHAEYMAFLNALLEANREADAMRYAPAYPNPDGTQHHQLYERSNKGNFIPHPRSPKHLLHLPVTFVTLSAAHAFATWQSRLSEYEWSLPDEFEWEKAARGVDGRLYPWGDRFDPSWCSMKHSHQFEPNVDIVDSFPTDVSPYGVRGVAGNVKDWCSNTFHAEGPKQTEISVRTMALSHTGTLQGMDLSLQDQLDESITHTIRGGSWNESEVRVRVASRKGGVAERRYDNVGFRIIRYI